MLIEVLPVLYYHFGARKAETVSTIRGSEYNAINSTHAREVGIYAQCRRLGDHGQPNSRRLNRPIHSFDLVGEALEVVERLTYLDEVTERILKAQVAFTKLKHPWRQSGVSRNPKGLVHQATMWAVLLYDCETWQVRAAELRHLHVSENRYLRKIRGELQRTEQEIRRRVSISNQDVTKTTVTCILCGRSESHTNLGRIPDAHWAICADCGNHACHNCGSFLGRATDKDPVWLCNFCQKKRKLEISSGAWLTNLTTTSKQSKTLKKYLAHKRPLARTSSFTQYEEWIDRVGDDTSSDTSSQDEQAKVVPKDTRRFSDTHFLSQVYRGRRYLTEHVSPECNRQGKHLEPCSPNHSQRSEETVNKKDSGHASSVDEIQSNEMDQEIENVSPPQEVRITPQETAVVNPKSETDSALKQADIGVKVLDETEEPEDQPEERIPSYDLSDEPNTAQRFEDAPDLESSSETIIHPDTSEVKTLFLHPRPSCSEPKSASTSTVTEKTTGTMWPPGALWLNVDENPAKNWSIYDSFNESFNEMDYPEFEDSTMNQQQVPLSKEKAYEELWFGIQHGAQAFENYPPSQTLDLCSIPTDDLDEGSLSHDSKESTPSPMKTSGTAHPRPFYPARPVKKTEKLQTTEEMVFDFSKEAQCDRLAVCKKLDSDGHLDVFSEDAVTQNFFPRSPSPTDPEVVAKTELACVTCTTSDRDRCTTETYIVAGEQPDTEEPGDVNQYVTQQSITTSPEIAYPGLDTYERWISDISQFSYPVEAVSGQTALTGLRRCPHFENISGLTEATVDDKESEVLPTQGETEAQELLANSKEDTEEFAANEERPTRVWFRDAHLQVDNPSTTEKPLSMTLRQEDELWAALFNPSESLVESAKEVSAQLDLLSFGEEEDFRPNHLSRSTDLPPTPPEETPVIHLTGTASPDSRQDTACFSSTFRASASEDNISEMPVTLKTDVPCQKYQTPSGQISESLHSWLCDQAYINSSIFSGNAEFEQQKSGGQLRPTAPPQNQQLELFPYEPHLEHLEFGNETSQPTDHSANSDNHSIASGSPDETGDYREALNSARIDDDQSVLAQTGNRSISGSGIDRPKGARETHVMQQHAITPNGLARWEGRKLPHLPSSYVGGVGPDDQTDLWEEQKSEEFGQDAKPVSSTSTTVADVDQSIGSFVFSIGLGQTGDEYRANSRGNKNEQLLLDSESKPSYFLREVLPYSLKNSVGSDIVSSHLHQSCEELHPTKSPVLVEEVDLKDTNTSSALALTQLQVVPSEDTATYTTSKNVSICNKDSCTETSEPAYTFAPDVTSQSPQRSPEEPDLVSVKSRKQDSTHKYFALTEWIPSNSPGSSVTLAFPLDHGLQIARNTLVSQSAYSSEDIDNFLTFLESPVDALPKRPELLQSGLFPYTSCCAPWRPCPLAELFSYPPSDTDRDLVITTEPEDIQSIPEATQYITKRTFKNTYEKVVIYERSQADLSPRVNFLERIQEETVLTSEEDSVVQQKTPERKVMSSSSSSRGSYPSKRRRPRSHSYTQDVLRFGEDPKSLQRPGILHRYTNNPRLVGQEYLNRRSFHDVRVGYGNAATLRDDVDMDGLAAVGHSLRRYAMGSRKVAGSLDYDLDGFEDEYQYQPAQALQSRTLHRPLKHGQNQRLISRYFAGRDPVRFPKLFSDLDELNMNKKWRMRDYPITPRPVDGTNVNFSDETDLTERRSYRSLPPSEPVSRRAKRPNGYSSFRRFTTPTMDLTQTGLLKRPSSLMSGRFHGPEGSSTALQLSKSTEHLYPGGIFRFGSGDTSMQTLRARLAAAHSESHLDTSLDDPQLMTDEYNYDNHYGSLDRRTTTDTLTAQQLRRQVERQHRQLLESLLKEPQWSPPLPTFDLTPTAILSSQPAGPQGTVPISEVCQTIHHGSLISSTMAPPIFSTATVRTSTDGALGWATDTSHATTSVPVNQALSIGTMNLTASPPATQAFQSCHQNALMDNNPLLQKLGELPSQQNEVIQAQTDATANILQLLKNSDLLQAITNNPELASQLSSLGLNFNLPDANQVTLAAMAGAMAATAIANAGLIDGTEFSGQPSTWSDQIQSSEDPLLGLPGQDEQCRPDFMRNADFRSGIPPYAISNEEDIRLERLLKQLNTALSLESEQNGFQQHTPIQANRSRPDEFQLPHNSMDSQVEAQNLYARSNQRVSQQQDGGLQFTMGPSQTIDKWLMPGMEREEQYQLVNGTAAEERLITPMDWPKFTSTQKQVKNGIGMRIVGGHIRSDGRLGAFVEEIDPRGPVDQLHGEIREGDEILEWNSIPLVDKTFEEVQAIINQVTEETEFLVRAFTHVANSDNEGWYLLGASQLASSERVDALCHHHAAQQALMGMQQRPTCPHVQTHFQALPPTEQCVHSHTASITAQQSRGQYSSSTGSESAHSSERKSSGRQPVSITVTEVTSRPESELYKQNSFESQRTSTHERTMSPTVDGRGPEELQSPTSSRSPTERKKGRLGSLTVSMGLEL
ncbi:protein piccolo [Clonorchis sinensis]|uniref:Protein piccolo n=1 Tax=Clonorchis sinensis TaxID=79923 RepID=G7Y3E0_CLOSI|nr:protein piccolo [Clonorchis sinensis]